jgi:hypothetical protein
MTDSYPKEAIMITSRDQMRTHYCFRDFLYYTCLLSVPVLTAILAILRHSVFWAVLFVGVAAAMTVLILKFYCTRCPHYTLEDGHLKCIFFWGLPKLFSPRPGALNVVDKVVVFGAPAVLLIFPLFWLFREPGLLILYLLSLAGFGATIYRNECDRCIYHECPVNRVPEAVKNHSQEPLE